MESQKIFSSVFQFMCPMALHKFNIFREPRAVSYATYHNNAY